MRRREFVTLIGGAAAAWPLAAHAQQPAMPVIGLLSSFSPDAFGQYLLAALRRGLKEAGYVEGQNVAIEYRWAEGHYDRLPALAADLVRRRVAVIVVSGGSPAAPVAKAATRTIPIVFSMGDDPVKIGLVDSLSQPGGNLTGVVSLNLELGPKRLELIHQLVPKAATIAVLLNPTNPITDRLSRDTEAGARALGRKIHVLHASTESEIDTAFATMRQVRAGGLVIGGDPFLYGQSERLATLALRDAIPAIYQYRPFVAAGGLMTYGSEIAELYRQVGLYVGRILAGAKPADLPVQQLTKIELVINLKTAKALGLTVPRTLLARADEVIE